MKILISKTIKRKGRLNRTGKIMRSNLNKLKLLLRNFKELKSRIRLNVQSISSLSKTIKKIGVSKSQTKSKIIIFLKIKN